MKRIMMMVALAAFMVAALSVSALSAFAGPDKDPNDGCTKTQGTWTCETTDLPGNSDANGQGSQPVTTVEDQTQGNKTNKSPEESQDLKSNDCQPGSSPGLCKQAERQ
jgi:hypothetical protein